MKLFVYPQHKKNQIMNPYTNNMERALSANFDIVHKEYKKRLPQPFRLLLNSTTADIYVLNWIESAADGEGGSFIRGIMVWLSLHIISIRNAKILWVFHNLHPHKGETKWSTIIRGFLFNKSTYIISHSREAAEYARQFANCPVYFKEHPVLKTDYSEWMGNLQQCDFYIWGNIYPYKGVLEFVRNPLCLSSKRKVYIVGNCHDNDLCKEISHYCNENVIFENRHADFCEVAAQCKKAKYVLFPYVGESVSSSGALMDTLLMGGTPIGPNRGAFKDLAEQGCCITYREIEDVFLLPFETGKCLRLEPNNVRTFIDNNTWNSFSDWIYNIINK